MDLDELKTELAALHEASFAWAMACCDRRAQDAEDVLGATYVKILTGRASFGGRSSVKTWLFAVIRNTAYEVLRKRRRRQMLLGQWSERHPEDAHEQANQGERLDEARQGEAVRAALEQLSENQRRVLELVFYHGMTIEDASDVMEMNLGTARTHYARGKKRMLARLSEDPSFEWEPTT